jgi:hypothetical protein
MGDHYQYQQTLGLGRDEPTKAEVKLRDHPNRHAGSIDAAACATLQFLHAWTPTTSSLMTDAKPSTTFASAPPHHHRPTQGLSPPAGPPTRRPTTTAMATIYGGLSW